MCESCFLCWVSTPSAAELLVIKMHALAQMAFYVLCGAVLKG